MKSSSAILEENTPVLETERLILRKLTASEEDRKAMFTVLSDPEVNTFLPWFPVRNLQETERHIRERYLDCYTLPSAYRYAICLKKDNRPIGYVGMSTDDSHDFGYGLHKDFWHRGIASEASAAVVKQIRNAGYPYITATHDVNNPRSGNVMIKLGMHYCYSYVEQWMPKDISVTFRMYQLNFDGQQERVFQKYRQQSPRHFIEAGV